MTMSKLSMSNCRMHLRLYPVSRILYGTRSHGIRYLRSSFTASLSSSVVDYPIEHGRRYHAYQTS